MNDRDDAGIESSKVGRLADDMAAVTTTLRFDETAHEMVKAAAAQCGVTTAQFIREAALVRAALSLERGRPPRTPEEAAHCIAGFSDVIAEVMRLSDV